MVEYVGDSQGAKQLAVAGDDLVGKELAETSYCWKSLLKNGVTVSNGSDTPVELPDVMARARKGGLLIL